MHSLADRYGLPGELSYDLGVVDTTPIIVCRDCGIFWGARADEPGCSDLSHKHSEGQLHRHRTLVVLPDGSRVVAVSFDPNDPYTREVRPDFGLYLDDRWSPPWPHDHLQWPDFGVPTSSAELRSRLSQLLERSRSGEHVELGCLGAHGRTGTALACLAILAGVPASDAVAWVRTAHCEKAVETPEQMAFVADFGD